MDVNFSLKQRTAFIRAFYDQGVAPFLETQRRIDQGEPPFDDPPYSEDPEPPYLAEWIDAATGVELGLADTPATGRQPHAAPVVSSARD